MRTNISTASHLGHREDLPVEAGESWEGISEHCDEESFWDGAGKTFGIRDWKVMVSVEDQIKEPVCIFEIVSIGLYNEDSKNQIIIKRWLMKYQNKKTKNLNNLENWNSLK